MIGPVVLIGLMLLVPFFASAEQGGWHLVPQCGQYQDFSVVNPETEQTETGRQFVPCGTCELFQLIDNILKFIWNPIAIVIAALMLAYGGILMIVPSFGGSVVMYEKGKKALFNTLIGLMIVFAAWLIIDTIIKVIVANPQFGVLSQQPAQIEGYGPWNSFTCEIAKPIYVPATPAVTPGLTTLPPGTLGESEARSALAQNGVTVNKSPCPPGVPYQQVTGGCTSLEGIRSSTLSVATDIKNVCGGTVIVTGGTELGHSSGANSHSMGYKIDIARNNALDTCIEQTFGPSSGKRSDGATIYLAPNGVEWAKEHDHWDVKGWEATRS
jgi:hypothetical protein